VALIVDCEAETYNNKEAPGKGGDKVVSWTRYNFGSSNACCLGGPNTSKNSKLRSAGLEMNMFNDASLPINR
jgi:hypothetical protein